MPAPPTIPRFKLFRRMIPTARNPILGFNKYLQEYGPTFRIDIGGSRRSYLTTEPDLIQHVLQKNHRNYEKSYIQTEQMGKYIGYGLLTNSGASWLRQRRLIQPGFHRNRIENLIEEMQRSIEQQCVELDRAAKSGEAIPVEVFTLQLAFRIIARAIFTDGFNQQEMEWLDDMMHRIQRYVVYPIRLPFLEPVLKLTGQERRHLDYSAKVEQKILDRINARRSEGEHSDRNDLLQMLLDSRYEDDGSPMEDRRLIHEVMILFAAGHETSANALTWILYLLDRHPEEKEKARAEIKSVLGDKTPVAADLRLLPFLTALIEEGMRLYPPAWITDRVALEQDRFGDVDIPEGMVVVPFIYGVHHSPLLYDSPESFRPERMLPAAKKERHPFAYLPFGGGPRLCIGMNFAMYEMQLALIHLLRHYDLVLAEEKPVAPKPYLTLRPERSVMMKVRRAAPF
ncbi:cytochrome P450 [Lewinellaceae bacterium SD302]|nr:cytochrome P450 [Lewinellaceae bacterium SD302]